MQQYKTLLHIQEDLFGDKITCLEIVQYYIQNIHTHNQNLNVFLSVYEQESLQKAKEIDVKIQQKKAGKLAGLVVGLKDVLCYENHPLQASSYILDGFVSQFSAHVVERLLAEDAIIIGRQNCDEFAMGSSNENSAFGVTKNFLDDTRVSGGSSGASAVSVQSDMCRIALGTDTGGSVRQPASFCGVIGLKPTYSRVSRHGLLAYASSFDCVGIFGKCIEDVALVLEVIAGKDEFDSTVSTLPVPSYSQLLETKNQHKKIVFFKEIFENDGLSQIVKEKTLQKIEALKNAGHQVEGIDFHFLKYLLPTYYILTTAEASSNLSRYDGVRYGHRAENAKNLQEMYVKSRSEGFGKEVKKRILLGNFVLSADYYDAYFTKAQKIRRIIQQKTEELLQKYDFILMPTTPDVAFKIGTKTKNQMQMYLEDVFTVQANVVGIPAISIPNGTNENGLPIGLQLMTKYFGEHELLSFAKEIENL
ncbi:MAG: Asp-tRNA(Asn)/Glu-tRNA(Gln) amidotransferase subunit GatA [Bacteroidetes bacterium]|nr:MAG: Asp-tRNA(Asn)/Glu-tRNA(Gln) amidotransferase subunit GatA [Bacteroidota bacterium]TAG87490.1 MAG: Asp-tRNA(Asn)/Glu-tRNA(Gln) amidotransferase subunit GatA [Bacteroidota bacterium]